MSIATTVTIKIAAATLKWNILVVINIINTYCNYDEDDDDDNYSNNNNNNNKGFREKGIYAV